MNKMKLFKRIEKYPKVMKALQVFSSILFILMLTLILLSCISSKRCLRVISEIYVGAAEIDETYFEGYYSYGFTDQMCEKLLEGDEMKSITSEILSEKFLAIFGKTNTFRFSEEEIKNSVKEEIRKVVNEEGVELSEEVLDSLTDYTMDISGISVMLRFDTPAQYRTAVYDLDKGNMDFVNTFLESLAKISSPIFPVFIGVLYLVTVVIMTILGRKKDIAIPVADTAIYPSLAIFAFSIGEIFMPGASEVTDYIFRYVFLISGLGVLFGVGLMVLYRYLAGRIRNKKPKFHIKTMVQ